MMLRGEIINGRRSYQVNVNMRNRDIMDGYDLPDEIVESDDWPSNIERGVQHIADIIPEGIHLFRVRDRLAFSV